MYTFWVCFAWLYIFMYILAKKKSSNNITATHTDISIYIYICICIYIHMYTRHVIRGSLVRVPPGVSHIFKNILIFFCVFMTYISFSNTFCICIACLSIFMCMLWKSWVLISRNPHRSDTCVLYCISNWHISIIWYGAIPAWYQHDGIWYRLEDGVSL